MTVVANANDVGSGLESVSGKAGKIMAVFLSFVITTRNKKEMLAEMLESVIGSLMHDEEVIVIDSNSSDGTPEYLTTLCNEGLISFFTSEPDVGEAHGFNKGILRARGEYIKILSDDDVYDWGLVRAIKNWLKLNYIDVLFTNGLTSTVDETATPLEYSSEFERWRTTRDPFAFCGLGLFIRKDSLPLVGLFSTSFKRVDAEFSLRLTAMRANVILGFSPQYVWLRRLNPASNSVRLKTEIRDEMLLLLLIYTKITGSIRWILKRKLYKPAKIIKINTPNLMILNYGDSLSALEEANKWDTTLPLCISSADAQ